MTGPDRFLKVLLRVFLFTEFVLSASCISSAQSALMSPSSWHWGRNTLYSFILFTYFNNIIYVIKLYDDLKKQESSPNLESFL